MKRSYLCTLIAASLLGAGCSQEFLEPKRDTSILTNEDVAEIAETNPAIINGALEGVYSYMVQNRAVTTGHYDFGQKGVDIWMDIVCGDMALSASAYGWYDNPANLLSTVDFTRAENRTIWQYYYKVINLSNNVINYIGGNGVTPDTAEGRHIMGQAKALRAYAYFYLAQLFQREYNPTQPILPFYNGEISNYGKVPASQIYDLIISDLNTSIELLDDYSRDTKYKVNKSVAQGLLAYTYAAMGNYQQARVFADQVIATSGSPLTTLGQTAFPGTGSGFNNVNTPSWIWGYDITDVMGEQLINWWGQMDYFTYSYASAGDQKAIDDALYAAIPPGDVRKTQFSTSPATLLMPLNKFFAPARTWQGQYFITTDYLFMRVDEFYLLSAEAAARTGDEAAARTRLAELLTQRLAGGAGAATAYVTGLTGQALQNAIYLQTRIELWGEGKSYLAMKRNQATVTRGTNHVFRAGQSFQYNSDELSFQIPQIELNNNPAITEQN
ncbi:RagB/SusD family nutrient uptake outer membrane protein [Flavobacterium sp. J372]|uniref:RagB/SusD family nutrient uptake outer membrane protein n=1 Tax=Flavobacterium sp. J372 TaxID=2898436 RepID=UPI0021507D08|nr:RagB/SusD family nutrient uptake outer membrane protein [Flavobacterium sp. J372]MCR5863234.1 RagB/SusD family nutrient uptake outer membrane protein [Flavobacterium sp. J372]